MPVARAYDALIAASAIARGLPLYTCNPHDFDEFLNSTSGRFHTPITEARRFQGVVHAGAPGQAANQPAAVGTTTLRARLTATNEVRARVGESRARFGIEMFVAWTPSTNRRPRLRNSHGFNQDVHQTRSLNKLTQLDGKLMRSTH